MKYETPEIDQINFSRSFIARGNFPENWIVLFQSLIYIIFYLFKWHFSHSIDFQFYAYIRFK